jgi:hypothetical protein
MSTSVDIIFLDSTTLGEPGSLEKILTSFSDSGFDIKEMQVEGEGFSQSESFGSAHEITELAYKAQTLSFAAVNFDWSMEIYQQIAWGERKMGKRDRVYIRTSTDNMGLWRAGYDNARYSSFFLDIGRKLYEVVEPSFGWIDQYHGWTTTHEDIESLNLQMLYWANFFGPKFVQKLGRDRILNAPAWRIEELADGGMLYLLAPHLGQSDEHVPLESVKEYFGVERVR